jgi:DNA-binding Lrp family transcriptional regulator
VLALAERTGLSRNTVQARLSRLEARAVLGSFERRIDPAALGHPLVAFVAVQVVQRRLDAAADALAAVPEVIEVLGMSGQMDLLVQVAARDADDLYRVAAVVLAVDGVVDHRLRPLLERVAEGAPDDRSRS